MHVGTKYTAEALEKIIVGLQEKGYEFVPVSQLIYTGEYKVDQMGRQIEK
jgi:peptidoglycan/xylan/chitin deacetylase (PgdA/CDA1 family)